MKHLFVVLLPLWLAASVLDDKIVSLIGEDAFVQNEAFIHIVFSPEAAYVHDGRIDVVKVVQTLRENGLLSLFFESPQTLTLTFETNGLSQFFLVLMNAVLHDMGYNHYLTDKIHSDNTGFSWRIVLESEYATDPTALQNALVRHGCGIADLERIDATHWRYRIDMRDAHLTSVVLPHGKKVTLKRLVYPRWIDVTGARKLTLWSLKGNNWYPYIAFYDDSLRLLKLYKRDKRSWQIIINLPRGCTYVKIADLYSRKNMKAGLSVEVQ